MELASATRSERVSQPPAPVRDQTHLTPIDRLQRSAGNHAVGSLIQRCSSGHT
jgi:hypothetical protein